MELCYSAMYNCTWVVSMIMEKQTKQNLKLEREMIKKVKITEREKQNMEQI